MGKTVFLSPCAINPNDKKMLVPIANELRKLGVSTQVLTHPGPDDMGGDQSWPDGLPPEDALIVLANPRAIDYAFWDTNTRFAKARFANVRHGIGSEKTVRVPADCLSRIEVTYVASAHAARRVKKYAPDHEVVVAGFVQMDALFEKMHTPRAVTPGHNILYAPTWNDAFNGRYEWFTEWASALPNEGPLRVRVSLHPLSTQSSSAQAVDDLCFQSFTTLGPVDSAGGTLAGEMWLSDAMIGDVGSSMFIYLATGRPIFAYNSFRWWEDSRSWNEEDDNWRFRDIAYQFSTPEELDLLLDAVLVRGNDPLRLRREACRDVMYGSTLDGKVAARIAEDLYRRWELGG